MHLYAGQILFVDLTNHKWHTKPLTREVAETYLGGRGLGIRLLYDLIPAGTEPFGPENVLYVGSGSFAGTTLPGNSRTVFMAKSPLGQIGWSNAGGHFGAELRYTGYDAVLFSGKSPDLVYVVIKNNDIEFYPANHLKENHVNDTYNQICKETGINDSEAFIIGPAGEHRVMYSSIISAGRLSGKAAGRTGIGAVMGTKNVKALVARGDASVTVANPDLFSSAVEDFHNLTSNDPGLALHRKWGTSILVTSIGNNGALVTRNFQSGVFENQEEINERSLINYVVKRNACFGCIHMCTGMVRIKDGPYAGVTTKKPEFETLAMLGSNIGEGRLDAIIKYNQMVDELGLDCISLGASISFAQELWQRGLLTEEDTDGLDLSWGNTEAVEQLIEDIAYRRTKLADILADGVREASKKIKRGSEKYAMHTKGLEIIGGDPRGQFGFALGYSTCTRGGDHLGSLPKAEYFNEPKMGKKLFDSEESTTRLGVKGKGRLVKWHEDFQTLLDALNVCKGEYAASHSFEFTLAIPKILAKAYTGATGWNVTAEDLLLKGERIYNLERLFNLREGLTVKDDSLPRRFLEEPLKSGASAGVVVPFAEMLSEYYKARGWDPKSGFPQKNTASRLNLSQDVKLVRMVLKNKNN